jgi:hypothetical protein
MSTTALAIVSRALRKIGALAQGESVSASEAADALTELNGMVNEWSTNNLLVYANVREEFSFTASQASYTLGSGGNWSTTRPVEIWKVMLGDNTQTPPLELPIDIITDKRLWAEIPNKDLTDAYPEKVFRFNTWPLDTLQFWPVPTTAHKAVIYSEKPLSSFSLISSTVDLPDGYENALVYNLAVRLAPEYDKEASRTVQRIAWSTLKDIERMNSEVPTMAADSGFVRVPFDIRQR